MDGNKESDASFIFTEMNPKLYFSREDAMRYHEVDLCDEYCPFYEKSSYEHRFFHDYAPLKKFLVIFLSVGVALNKR